jgi:endonuclease-3
MDNSTALCAWNRDRVLKLLDILLNRYTIDLSEFVVGHISTMEKPSYFEILVAIILSQNTSDRNAIKAFKNLKNSLGLITPEKIIKLPDDYLASLIKVAGLTYRRVRILKALATKVLETPDIFSKIENAEPEHARTLLLSLPGVGSKTADVFLLMVLNKPTFPIDTHIDRVTRRLGLASPEDDYEDIRVKMMNLLENDVNKLRYMHLLLIVHGRNVCKARNPSCSQCVLVDMCCRRL